MELNYFWSRIKLDKNAILELNKIDISNEKYQRVKSEFYNNRASFYKNVINEENYRLKFLYYYGKMAIESYTYYKNQGITDEIYFDTYSDLAIWNQDCFERYNTYGINEYKWFEKHLDYKLFRLGRLQFEISENAPSFYNKTINNEQKQIAVHIPKGDKLTKTNINDAFIKALDFFGKDCLFFCHSWLLYPKLKNILNENSGIIEFQKCFELVCVDYQKRQAEERIYGKVEVDINNYPENSTLQIKAKDYLLSGKSLGRGLGVYKIHDKQKIS